MRLVAILRGALWLLAPLSLLSTVYLYFYPLFLRYSFPLPLSISSPTTSFLDTLSRHAPVPIPSLQHGRAPFRLLAIGDPQLEGDTSIPTTWLGHMPHFFSMLEHALYETEHDSLRERLAAIAHDAVDVVFEDLHNELVSLRKRIDLIGNDMYLSHIYRTMHWWTDPTHVTVLGDLVGSQWIDDAEFKSRGDRFWNTVFVGGQRVPDSVASYPSAEYQLTGYLDKANDSESDVWKKRIINVAGNHDIGYAGDLTVERMERFEYTYGKANYELRFELPLSTLSNGDLDAEAAINATLFDEANNPESTRLTPELRLVIVNDMNLDTPVKVANLQDYTYNFLNDVIDTASAVEFDGHMTVVLTHIPLHKDRGICVDAPYFDFHEESEGGGVREQYMLSYDASKGFTEGMLGINSDKGAAAGGRGRPGVILNGHDHAGCDTWHYMNQTNGTDTRWQVKRYADAKRAKIPGAADMPGVRELTIRSIMGDFGGNVGLFSAWFDEDSWSWKFDYADAPLGKQHIWWAVHGIDLISIIVMSIAVLDTVLRTAGIDIEAKLRNLKITALDTPSSKIYEKKKTAEPYCHQSSGTYPSQD